MLWTIIAGLAIVWLVATVLKFTVGGLMHILLVVAIALLIYNLVT